MAVLLPGRTARCGSTTLRDTDLWNRSAGEDPLPEPFLARPAMERPGARGVQMLLFLFLGFTDSGELSRAVMGHEKCGGLTLRGPIASFDKSECGCVKEVRVRCSASTPTAIR